MNNRLEDLLYPIADAMQVSLRYRTGNGRISGKRKVRLSLAKGVDITATMEAVSSFVNQKEQQAGVLFHIKGQMYMLVVHNSRGQSISSYIISSKVLGKRRVELVDFLPSLCNIKTAVTNLSGGVKKAYHKTAKGHEWSVLELPKSMRV